MFTLNTKRSLRPLWIVDTRLPWKYVINKCSKDMENWVFFSFLQRRLFFISALGALLFLTQVLIKIKHINGHKECASPSVKMKYTTTSRSQLPFGKSKGRTFYFIDASRGLVATGQ